MAKQNLSRKTLNCSNPLESIAVKIPGSWGGDHIWSRYVPNLPQIPKDSSGLGGSKHCPTHMGWFPQGSPHGDFPPKSPLPWLLIQEVRFCPIRSNLFTDFSGNSIGQTIKGSFMNLIIKFCNLCWVFNKTMISLCTAVLYSEAAAKRRLK